MQVLQCQCLQVWINHHWKTQLFMVSSLPSSGGTSWTMGKRKPENSRTSWNVWRSKTLASSDDLLMVFWLFNLLPIQGIGIVKPKLLGCCIYFQTEVNSPGKEHWLWIIAWFLIFNLFLWLFRSGVLVLGALYHQRFAFFTSCLH